MENSRAKDIMLKCFDRLCGDYHYQNVEKVGLEDALWKAVQALELQIPKKVIYKGYDDQDAILCPNCNEEVGWIDMWECGRDNYCNKCGQKLNWEK